MRRVWDLFNRFLDAYASQGLASLAHSVCPVICKGLKNISNGLLCVSEWYKIVPDWNKWCSMVTNVTQWYPMLPDATQCNMP